MQFCNWALSTCVNKFQNWFTEQLMHYDNLDYHTLYVQLYIIYDEFRELETEKNNTLHSTELSASFDPISTKWAWKLQWKINYSQLFSTQFWMIFAVLWLLLMPLEFQRNKTETMTTEEVADKRQAGRREWQESQRDTGKEEGKKICLFFKAHEWNLFAENWSDMVETVTDVACVGAWSVSRGLKCVLTDTCCACSRVGPFSERREIKSGKNGVGGMTQNLFPIQ